MSQKKATFDIRLNTIKDTDDPTKKEVSFFLHDFRINHNNNFISKETAKKALDTLEGKPIVCEYYPKSDHESDDDALGGHAARIGEDRKDGSPMIELDTIPIGVFTKPARIETITDDNDEEVEVVVGDGILWNTRFSNAVGLIQEWYEKGIDVVSSMEIMYDEYKFKDGVEEILNYYYTGHAVLNSEDRGGHSKINPAYDVSKLRHLVAQAVDQDKDKRSDKVDNFKKVFEISHEDIRSKLYEKLDPTLNDNQWSFIVEVFDDRFVAYVETYTDDSYESKFYQYSYKTEEEKVEIDFDSKVEVKEKREWVKLEQVQEFKKKLNEKEEELKSANSERDKVVKEKEEIEAKFNKASEDLLALNEQVDKLETYKNKYKKEQYEKKLANNKEHFSAKFEALGATDKYESEEVQKLIEDSAKDDSAITQLNSILVDLVSVQEVEKNKEDIGLKHYSTKRDKLLDVDHDFDSRYK